MFDFRRKQDILRLIAAAGLLCFAAWAQSNPVTWSPVLKLTSRDAIGARLAQPFGDIFEGTAAGTKASISNCNDYFRLAVSGFKADNDLAGRVLHNDAVECVALKMIQSARKPRRWFLPGFQLNAMALSILPPELAPAVSDELIAKAKSADEAGQSWSTYLPDAVAMGAGKDELDVAQSGWKTHLTSYATGDFTGRGNEEILIRADYQAVSGTYSNSKLFLLAAGNSGAKRLRLVRDVVVK